MRVVANGMDGDLLRDIRQNTRYNSIHTTPDARYNAERQKLEKFLPETEYKRNVDLDDQIERRLSGNDFKTLSIDNSAYKVCSEEGKVGSDLQNMPITTKNKARVKFDVSNISQKQ